MKQESLKDHLAIYEQPAWVRDYMKHYHLRAYRRKFDGDYFYLREFVEFTPINGVRLNYMVVYALSSNDAKAQVKEDLPSNCKINEVVRLSYNIYLAHYSNKDGKKSDKVAEVKKVTDVWRKKGYKVRVVPYGGNGRSAREAYFIYVRK